MTELLDAVDALTKPIRFRVRQGSYETELGSDGRPKVDEEGNPVRHLVGTTTRTVEHEPLLTQLEHAIRGAMGTTEGDAATLTSTRGMVNSEALYQFTRIRSMITDWARMAGATRDRDPVVELRRWYHTWIADDREDAAVRWHTRKLTSWATVIEETLDPRDTRTLPGPCPNPECPQQEAFGLWFYWDARTREQGNRPLIVEYRKSDDHLMVINARGKCRACGTVWESVRALQYDREHAEITRM